jgi:hypothetical protein
VASILLGLKGHLAHRRRSASKRVSPKRLKRLLGTLEDVAGGLRAQLLRDPAAIESGLASERDRAAAARAALSEAAKHPEDVRLHEARVAVKKWRYAVECLREALPDRPVHGIPALRRMQGTLGDVHDLGLLRDLIARLAPAANDAPPRALGALIGRLEGERRRAVHKFQRLAPALLGVSPPASLSAPDRGHQPAAPAPPVAAGTTLPAEPRISAAAEDPEPGRTQPAAGSTKDSRERRWVQMASWLEETRRRS